MITGDRWDLLDGDPPCPTCGVPVRGTILLKVLGGTVADPCGHPLTAWKVDTDPTGIYLSSGHAPIPPHQPQRLLAPVHTPEAHQAISAELVACTLGTRRRTEAARRRARPDHARNTHHQPRGSADLAEPMRYALRQLGPAVATPESPGPGPQAGRSAFRG